MVEQVYENIYRIFVPLKGNPLKELNSYFIKGDERDLVIDTGFRWIECERPLMEGLAEVGSDPARRDVFITHFHSDHMGNADKACGPGGHIYMSRIDMEFLKGNIRGGDNRVQRENRFLYDGFTPELLKQLESTNPARIYALTTLDDRFIAMDAGDHLKVGDFDFEFVLTPGHTPGNSMLWDGNHKIMFTGDNVLFDITPNITAWPGMPDTLGSYLDSLRRSDEYPVELALPAHRQTGDYHERIKQLLKHHEARLAECLQVIKDYPNSHAMEIASHMTWKIRARNWDEFPTPQKWFAVGECQSHLDYLEVRGIIEKREENGHYLYTAK